MRISHTSALSVGKWRSIASVERREPEILFKSILEGIKKLNFVFHVTPVLHKYK